jgi:hypothetical protein
VNPSHPHIGNIAGGVAMTSGVGAKGYLDYNGHGTAVTAAVHEKAPAASLYVVKVFEKVLITRTDRIVKALEWCLHQQMQVVNLSIGIPAGPYTTAFGRIVEASKLQGMLIVAPASWRGVPSLPGCIPGVIAVDEDPDCARDQFRGAGVNGRNLFYCSGYARPIPGIPPENNLRGISFAVANMTGFVARALEDTPATEIERELLSFVRQ